MIAPLLWVQIEGADPAALRADGYDVVAEEPVQVVGDAAEIARLDGPVSLIRQGRPLRAAGASVGPGYLPLDGVLAELDRLAGEHPDIARVVDLTATLGAPPTFEGRSLFALRVSDAVGVDEDEPSVLLVATHHAREVNTPVAALEAAVRLVEGYGTDPVLTDLVDSHELWIAPVWNPDGYTYVFDVDDLWRKNRWNGVGVDLNRNYPIGWSSPCGGAPQQGSATFRGPSAASEPEVQTLMAWTEAERFAKVVDLHSYGREVLWGLACQGHPLDAQLQADAATLAATAGYGERPPSAEGEHYEWQWALRGASAQLVEISTVFQPPYAEAVAEADRVWPLILAAFQREPTVSGHVVDACTGDPVAAALSLPDLGWPEDLEVWTSGGPFGRFDLFVSEPGATLEVSAEGYVGAAVPVAAVVDLALVPDGVVDGDGDGWLSCEDCDDADPERAADCTPPPVDAPTGDTAPPVQADPPEASGAEEPGGCGCGTADAPTPVAWVLLLTSVAAARAARSRSSNRWNRPQGDVTTR